MSYIYICITGHSQKAVNQVAAFDANTKSSANHKMINDDDEWFVSTVSTLGQDAA